MQTYSHEKTCILDYWSISDEWIPPLLLQVLVLCYPCGKLKFLPPDYKLNVINIRFGSLFWLQKPSVRRSQFHWNLDPYLYYFWARYKWSLPKVYNTWSPKFGKWSWRILEKCRIIPRRSNTEYGIWELTLKILTKAKMRPCNYKMVSGYIIYERATDSLAESIKDMHMIHCKCPNRAQQSSEGRIKNLGLGSKIRTFLGPF